MARLLFLPLLCISLAQAQAPTAPVVSPRGVVNAYTQVPAPSRVTAGGIIWINGLNLGPPEGAKATGLPLPTELAGIKVLINNREAPIFSVSPNRIEAQVPVEIVAATANIIVRKGQESSRPARINIVAIEPGIRSADGSGFGAAEAINTTNTITVKATGLGPTQPRAATGEAGPEDATLVSPLRAYIGGILTPATATPSADRPGEFDISIAVPEQAQPGDVLNVVAGNNLAVNPRRLYSPADQPSMKFLALPSGPPIDIRALAASDLRAEFAMAAGPRAENGCYPAYRIDFQAMRFSTAAPCVTAGNRNQPNPFTPALEGSAIAALVGPPEGEIPNGVSSKMAIFAPLSADVMQADLPSTATNIGSQNGGFRVALTGTNPPAVLVDAESAEVTPVQGGGGGGVVVLPGGGGAGGGAAAVCLNPNLSVDLGDGLNKIISCTQMTAQSVAAVIADDENAPKKAKMATLNLQGQVQGAAVDFPPGVLPLVLPAAPIQQGPGGGMLPGGAGAVVNRIRALSIVDANTVYVVARAADGSTNSSADSMVAFTPNQPATALAFPTGWFVASCTPQVRIFSLDLARQIGLPATKSLERESKANCPAYGFILLNRDTRQITVSESTGREGYNAASQAGEVADYIYTVSTNPQRVNVAESLFILDSTNGSSFRLDLPSGVVGFSQIREEQSLLALMAPANATQQGNGDAGIAVFDIESASAKLLPTPDGFANVQLLAIFDITRKIVARGMRNGNSGSALLVYDLTSGDLYMPQAPASCAFAGALPPVPGGGGGGQGQQQQQVNLTAVNPKANSVIAGCFDSNRRLTGFLFIKSN